MKNAMNKHYDHFYVLDDNEQTVEVTRTECFAPGETPTAENPYKQRWLQDVEAGYIIRLPRTEQGEKLYRLNASAVRCEERHYARKYACVRKGTEECNSDCGNCQKRVARTVDLDKPCCSDGESDEESYLNIAAPDYLAEREEKEERAEDYARLHEVIDALSPKRRKVCILYFFKDYTAKQIGEMFGVTEAAVLQQIYTIKKIIKKLFLKPYVSDFRRPYKGEGQKNSPSMEVKNVAYQKKNA